MRVTKYWRARIAACVGATAFILVSSASMATPGANTSYTYDSIGRVTKVVIDNGGTNGLTTISYSYDAAGNRTAVVTTTATNTAPTATNDALSTAKNVALTFDPRSNDSDAQGQTLTITSLGTPSSGTAAINADGTVTYTPASNYTGTATFTYTISDGALTASATDTITVTAGPAANSDSISIPQNAAYTFDPRANDSAPSGMTLTVSALGAPSHGWATIGSGGTSVVYTPIAGYSGSDSFTYTVSDGHGGSATATVTVAVMGPPVANNDSIVTITNTAKTFDPRTNDTDPQSHSLTVTSVGSASHGSTSYTGTSVTYTPNTGYTGSDSFTYTISNGTLTSTGTVAVTVNSYTAPTAVNDSDGIDEFVGSGTHLVTLDPRINDISPSGLPLTVTAVTQGTYGTVTFTGTSVTYTYCCNLQTQRTDTFTYTISDGYNTSTATVTIDITLTRDGSG